MTGVVAAGVGGPAPAYREVFAVLEAEGLRYCVLRGEPWADAGAAEVDLLIHPDERRRVDRLLAGLGFVRRGRGAGPYKAVYVDYRAGRLACLDLHEEVVQEGLVYMDRDLVLERRVRHQGLYVPSKEDLLLHLVWHHLLRRTATPPAAKARIRELLRARLDTAYVRQQLEAFGLAGLFERTCRLIAADDEPVAERRRLRRAFRVAVCRHRRGNLTSHLRFRLARWRAGWRRGGLVVLVGPDGVGKSTVVEAVEARARALGRPRLVSVYLGPWGRLELPLVRWLRKAGLTPCPEPWGLWLAARFGLGRGRGGPLPAWSPAYLLSKWLRSLAKGGLFYAAVYLELLYRYARGVWLRTRKGDWVIADRYVTDLRYLYKGDPIPNYPLLRWLVVRLFPRPDLVILLDNTPEVICRRKGGLTPEQLGTIRELYRRAIAGFPHEIVMTDRPPQEVSEHVLRRVVHLAAQR